MQADRRDAEVLSFTEGRRARALRSTSPPGDRPRCSTTTVDGRACRNYAAASGLCRVHEARRSVQRPEGTASAVGPAVDVAVSGTDGAADASIRDGQRDGPGPVRARLDDAVTGVASWALGGPTAGLPPGAVDAFAALRSLGQEALVDQAPALLAFLRRRLTADYEVDEFGFDEDLTTNVLMPMLRPMHRLYWRVASYGSEHLPTHGGGLVVANHAGTLPADALITRLDIFDATGRHARELGADLVFRTPFVGSMARKTGVTLASGDDADRLLAAGELVAVWPEGYKGLGKPWRDRYRLQRFGRGGFVATALRARVPIVPTAIVGSEEIYPLLFDLRVLARALGLPYFPVVAQMFALPVLGPFALLPLPSKWIIEYGEPIDTTAYGPEAADDPMVQFDLADQVRDRIQSMVHRNLMGRRSVFV